jgi:hypothetical protein
MDQSSSLARELALVLHSFEHPSCQQAAEQLEDHAATTNGLTLAFRSLQLSVAQVEVLADIIKTHREESPHALRSLSFSYNELGDTGAVALAEALPLHLAELGLVGCSIGDRGGAAILEWATRAKQLRMLCIENNHFSPELRRRFYDLSAQRGGLAVYV